MWQINAHSSNIFDVGFNLKGTSVVTASLDKTAAVWEIGNSQPRYRLTDHSDEVEKASFAVDDSVVYTMTHDGVVRIWDAKTASLVALATSDDRNMIASYLARSGDRLLVSSGNGARYFNLQGPNNVVVLRGHDGVIQGLDFSKDGKWVATGSEVGRVFDAFSGRLLSVLRGHAAPVSAVKFDPTGHYIATASDDHTVRIWSVPDGRAIATIGLGDLVPADIDLAQGGERLIVVTNNPSEHADLFSTRTWLWDVQRRVRLGNPDEADELEWARFDPSGTIVLAVNAGGAVLLLDARDGHRIKTVDREAGALFGTISADGGLGLFTTDSGPLVLDLKGSRPVAVYSEKGLTYLDVAAAAFRFSPDGREFAFSHGRQISFYASEKAERRDRWDLYSRDPRSIDYLSSGDRVIAALSDNSIELFDRGSRTVRAHLAGSNEQYSSPVLNQATDRLAVKWSDKTVRVYPFFRTLGNLRSAAESQFTPTLSPDERTRYLGQ